jgi:hypothetical protein
VNAPDKSADTFAISRSGFVAVREYGSSPPPATSLGLGRFSDAFNRL